MVPLFFQATNGTLKCGLLWQGGLKIKVKQGTKSTLCNKVKWSSNQHGLKIKSYRIEGLFKYEHNNLKHSHFRQKSEITLWPGNVYRALRTIVFSCRELNSMQEFRITYNVSCLGGGGCKFGTLQ